MPNHDDSMQGPERTSQQDHAIKVARRHVIAKSQDLRDMGAALTATKDQLQA